MTAERLKQIAAEAGFELAGVSAVEPTLESLFYAHWIDEGCHGEMRYLGGRRGEMRRDPKTLLPSARSILCVGQVYNSAEKPYSTEWDGEGLGWISRYAWGRDYHDTIKPRLRQIVARIEEEIGPVDSKICVDTSPLLERAYAHSAGLGWIGKNTCLINERIGSWFFLAEILLSLELETDDPAPFRCGTCTRCIDACPTDALLPNPGDEGPSHYLDSRRCISYWTIELRGPVPKENRAETGRHLFGCDICQDVCPWNRPGRAASTEAEEFQPTNAEPSLEELAAMSEEEFNRRFSGTPIERSRYQGFLRNVAVAMGASGEGRFVEPLRRLAEGPDDLVAEHARWALGRLGSWR